MKSHIKHRLIVLLFLFANESFGQEKLTGYYTGEICFRHCLFFKLKINKNGTYRMCTTGYRKNNRERGEWITYDGFITLTINGVRTYTYLIERNDLYYYDLTLKEKGEIAFQKKL